jgi:hypothetical protein
MMMRGLGLNSLESCTRLMNCLSICSVTVKSAITPSFIGRITVMLPGALPSISLASRPTAWIVFLALGPPSRRIETTMARQGRCAPTHIDQRVGCTEVDGEVVGEVFAEETEHVCSAGGCGKENFYDTL